MVRGIARPVVWAKILRKQAHLSKLALSNAPEGNMGPMEGHVRCALLASSSRILAGKRQCLALKTALQARIHLLEALLSHTAPAISGSQDPMARYARRAWQAPTKPARDHSLAAAARLVSGVIEPIYSSMRGKGVGSEREGCSGRNKRELGFNNASQVGIYQHISNKITVNLICMNESRQAQARRQAAQNRLPAHATLASQAPTAGCARRVSQAPTRWRREQQPAAAVPRVQRSNRRSS